MEFDLLFYKSYIVSHFICRATRWHAACAIPSKEGEVIFESLMSTWVTHHGPMERLISDGESGLWSAEIVSRMKRLGVEMTLRAPQQHARFIERRGAVLRATLHCLEEQAEREGLVITFPTLLGEAVFAGNSLTHVGGSTPYQCVYGRQPAMLPALETPDLQNAGDTSAAGEDQRAFIREAALQSMIQATSMARINRAAHAKTSPDSTQTFKIGDLVDIYRKPSSKDTSGWSGPHRVVKSEPGQVTVQVGGTDRTYRAQDARQALLVLMAEHQTTSWSECIHIVMAAMQELKPGQSSLFGFANHPLGSKVLSQAAKQNPAVLHALEHLFTNCWRVGETVGARLAVGAKALSAVSFASHSTVIWWFHKPDVDVRFGNVNNTRVNLADLIGPEHPKAFVIQALHAADHDITMADACDEAAALNHESLVEPILPDSDGDHSTIRTPDGPLSTIPEASDEDEAARTFLAMLPDSQEEVYAALKALFEAAANEPLEPVSTTEVCKLGHYEAPVDSSKACDFHPLSHYHAAQVDPSLYGNLDVQDEAGNPRIELWFSRDFAKVVGDDSLLPAEHTYVMQVYASGFRNTVIKRDTDLLTPQEMVTHKEEVQAAILEELKTWLKYKCFTRMSRDGATNIMDSRFVAKWKKTEGPDGKPRRIVRMRLALRGFKDLLAHELESYAATASRQAQRLLCSEVACNPGWKFVAVDINKAFLQGLTYAELCQLTGEDMREVQFTLPPESAELLRRLPGYESFDQRIEVLKCLKPGTGCVDAPRAFSLKLAQYTRDPKIGLKPSLYDSELEFKHREGRLVLILVKHVDDIKIAGEPAEVENLIRHLENGFGKLTYAADSFLNCGLQHVRHPDGSVEMNQDAYIDAMKPIQHPELTGRRSTDACTAEVHQLYQSLLGAVAYSLLSQAWAAVFVIALQRKTAAPQNIHVRRLNLLLAALQRQKRKLFFPAMRCARTIVVYSDASFAKESETKGYGMRGAVYLRMGTFQGKSVCHLLESQCQSLKLVTRSTFASETLAAVGAVDSLVPLLVSMQEVVHGALNPDQARSLRELGGFAFQSELRVDAMNLFYAVTAKYPKLPAEKALYIHVAWLRDLFRRRVPSLLSWCDTRDMVADGLTKGKIDRDALFDAMAGKCTVSHPLKTERYPVLSNSSGPVNISGQR